MARTISRFCVTPVKGTALVHPDEVLLDERGIAENRRFFLIDDRGDLFSGADLGMLVRIKASWDDGAELLTLDFPDGGDVTGEPVTTDFYGRPVSGRVLQGPWSEALSAYAGRSLRLVRTDRPGDGPDVEPLTIVSQASVRDLARLGGRDGDLDSRRFRINLEVEGCEPYEEDTWRGRRVRVGDAVLVVIRPVARCVVTTQDPTTGTKDFETLKVIARHRGRIDGRGGLPFGMYARVQEPGRVRVGDSVEPLE
ncbi:MAG: MOSC domain-containing protein [Actinomycetota bacterium]|nr:MOSC domain-containing protein [Actinomycetota bacterium]